MKRYLLFGLALLVGGTMPAFSQVSNDNEDGVYKIDERVGRNDFVPGQVLVKFKDESSIKVQRTSRGQFRAASISAVDRLLREYGVTDMEKLFPAEAAKPKAQLRRKMAPNGTMVQEKNLDKVFWIKTSVEGVDSTIQLIEQLKEMPEVEYAEPNYRVYITADMPQDYSPYIQPRQSNARRTPAATETTASMICPNPSQNPLYSNQYNIKLHNIDKLWDKPIINKKRPVIAILDTGVDINHPDLKDNIWVNTAELEGEKAYDDDGNGIVDDTYGWNFADDYRDVPDRNGHGTHVAGIAAACDNGIGVVGANPQALIMPVKVMNDRGQGNIATICRGIIYAAEMGADIINMSFGHNGECFPQTEVDAIQKAYISTILVASAGNNGASVYDICAGPLWPAAYYLVLGVQCSGQDGQRVWWSNYDPDGPIYSEDGIDGRNHEMMLAGVDIYSTLPDGQYNKLSGTSMSAPLLAGAISALNMVKEYPSKDVLFGDLIHLNADFEKIYSDETPRWPKIDVVSMEVDDNVMNNNADGQVDAGETIKFYPVLINTWADATDIKLKLSVDNYYKDFVQIINPHVDFGYSLSAYGRQKSESPIVVQFSSNIAHNTRIRFTMTISYHENEEPIQQDIYITVYNMVKLGGLIASDMTLTADKNYLVTSNLAIPEGVTLTIEPGTVVNFDGTGISSSGTVMIVGTPEKPITLRGVSNESGHNLRGIICGNSLIAYCIIENAYLSQSEGTFSNCIIHNGEFHSMGSLLLNTCTILGGECHTLYSNLNSINCNFAHMMKAGGWGGYSLPRWSSFSKSDNLINSVFIKPYSLYSESSKPEIIKVLQLPYLGSGREDIVRQWIADIHKGNGYGEFDLSNMPTRPYAEAHGIVWKVVVNSYDAQDEYEDLPPLGVGKHKFEVYFNRPMNKAKIPQVTFGVREPYNQHSVDEDGSWNEDGTIYTVYKTITGKTMSDGVNLIYVQGAEDNEYFECPYEKTRFHINLQAAGSMATGFAAEPGLGRVNLTWNNDNNDFEDAMGFNIYRFTVDEAGKADTVCINKEIVGIETTFYSDYNVTPGQTYYYLYRVLSTDLMEYDVSNVVAATPLTSTRGDANGSGGVDVADVITTVNYAAGMDPKPFIFEAADMNTDQMIDILDVVGIIQGILNPSLLASAMAETPEAVYTIENGVLYVESPVALAGIQAQLSLSEKGIVKSEEFATATDLDGFEHTSAWLTDNDYLFLAYNMNGKTLTPGKHALLYIGDAEIASLRLADVAGHNVTVRNGEDGRITGIDRMGKDVMNVNGVYDLYGRKIVNSNSSNGKLPKGVYIIDGVKVVK